MWALEVSGLADVHSDFGVEQVFLYIYHFITERFDAIRLHSLSCVSISCKSMKLRCSFRMSFSLSCISACVCLCVKERLPMWVWFIFLVSWVTNHSAFTDVSTRPWYFHASIYQPSKIVSLKFFHYLNYLIYYKREFVINSTKMIYFPHLLKMSSSSPPQPQ